MKTTLLSFESYLNGLGTSLFNNIQLPDSDLIEKETLVNTIMLECGEFEVLYNNPEFMQFATENFFKKHYRTFDKWVQALAIKYSPLENYDRIEEETIAPETDTHTRVDGLKRSTSVEGKITSTNHEGTMNNNTTRPSTQTSTDAYSGFSEVGASLTDGTRTTNKIGDNDSYTETTVTSQDPDDPTTTTVQGDSENPTTVEVGHIEGQSDTDTISRGERKRNSKIHGNIGVTTSQKMLASELEVATFNLYNEISRRYMVELTIPVYL